MSSEKMIFVAELPDFLLKTLGLNTNPIKIYRSKGLLAHLLKRKHYTAAKYLDYIPDVITKPDYAGLYAGQIELIKCFKDNIFLSIKLDQTKAQYYVATLFDVNQSKIDSYCKSGRLKKLDKDTNSLQ